MVVDYSKAKGNLILFDQMKMMN